MPPSPPRLRILSGTFLVTSPLDLSTALLLAVHDGRENLPTPWPATFVLLFSLPSACATTAPRGDGEQSADERVCSRRKCGLRLPLVAAPGDQRLRRNSSMEVGLR